jgi:phosphoribosylformimino-5-aminoimidazole carboxamide ribotide isomerase
VELIAAIDLLGGRARRLQEGDYDRPIEAQADPLHLARLWLAAGVRRLHVVDLDGARSGRPVNHRLLGQVCAVAAEATPGSRVQTGGGLRRTADVAAAFAAGASDVILGSAAIREPAFLAACASRWPGCVGAALDLRDGRPAVEGWTATVDAEPLELAAFLLEAGAAQLLVTDTRRDGMRAGPALELMAEFRARFPSAVLLCAGGVTTAGDLTALARIGIDGAVVGRALLEGTLDIVEALAACKTEVAA